MRKRQNSLPTSQPGEPSEQVDFKRDEETVHLCVRALRQHQHARQRRRRLSPPPPQPVGGAAVKVRPLFLYCDIDYPHGPFWRDMPAAALAAVNQSALGTPHNVPLGEMHPYDAAMSVARGLQHPPPSAEAAAAFRLAHFAKLAQTDAMVGRILDAAASTLRSTLVVLTSDHGEMIWGRGRGRGRSRGTSPPATVRYHAAGLTRSPGCSPARQGCSPACPALRAQPAAPRV